jgi:hypothetical protein
LSWVKAHCPRVRQAATIRLCAEFGDRYATREPHRFLQPLVRRLDRYIEAMNVILVVLAVGLSALDATCFLALHLTDAASYVGGTTTVTSTPATIMERVR